MDVIIAPALAVVRSVIGGGLRVDDAPFALLVVDLNTELSPQLWGNEATGQRGNTSSVLAGVAIVCAWTPASDPGARTRKSREGGAPT